MIGFDFGIGVAAGAIFETVKSILNLVEVSLPRRPPNNSTLNHIQEVKTNKQAAVNLARRCEAIRIELLQIFQDAETNGLYTGPIFEM